MATRLCHAVAGVDRSTARSQSGWSHVPRVLLVPGRVGDDELPLLGREVAVGHVDRDALFPLGSKPVDEQRQVGVAALGAVLLAVALDRRELVLVDALGVVEQPADERALAVVHAAAGEEAEELLALVACEVLVDRVGAGVEARVHQK